MAKVTPPQNIPSELLKAYRGAMGEIRTGDRVYKRYPFRVPPMQTKVGHPSVKQKKQRDRFNLVKEKFNSLTWEERQRWFDAMPEWGSLLWYYNFFMLSGLIDVLGADAKGAQVIKSIQNITDSIPAGGKTVTIPVAVDTSKVVVMVWGAGYNRTIEYFNESAVAWAWSVYPVWSNLQPNSIHISWSIAAWGAATVAIQIIEYI